MMIRLTLGCVVLTLALATSSLAEDKAPAAPKAPASAAAPANDAFKPAAGNSAPAGTVGGAAGSAAPAGTAGAAVPSGTAVAVGTAGVIPASAAALGAANRKMLDRMDFRMTGDADIDFVRAMIAHDQGAIDMANIALKYGKDPQIKILSESIISGQESEIVILQTWLKSHGK